MDHLSLYTGNIPSRSMVAECPTVFCIINMLLRHPLRVLPSLALENNQIWYDWPDRGDHQNLVHSQCKRTPFKHTPAYFLDFFLCLQVSHIQGKSEIVDEHCKMEIQIFFFFPQPLQTFLIIRGGVEMNGSQGCDRCINRSLGVANIRPHLLQIIRFSFMIWPRG